MLNLKKLNLSFNSQRHTYELEGRWLPGVTSIVGMLPKDFLLYWSAKEAANCVLEHWKPNKKYTKEEIAEICYLAKTAHTRKKELAADVGTQAHLWISQFSKDSNGIEPPLPEDKEVKSVIEQFNKWRNSNKIEWLASEQIIASEKYGYAGTCDAIVRLNGKLVVLDYKSSSGIYESYYIQVAAYVLALEEMGLEGIEDRWIIRLPKTGSSFEAVKIPTNLEDDKKVFLSLIDIYHWNKKVEKIKNERI